MQSGLACMYPQCYMTAGASDAAMQQRPACSHSLRFMIAQSSHAARLAVHPSPSCQQETAMQPGSFRGDHITAAMNPTAGVRGSVQQRRDLPRSCLAALPPPAAQQQGLTCSQGSSPGALSPSCQWSLQHLRSRAVISLSFSCNQLVILLLLERQSAHCGAASSSHQPDRGCKQLQTSPRPALHNSN